MEPRRAPLHHQTPPTTLHPIPPPPLLSAITTTSPMARAYSNLETTSAFRASTSGCQLHSLALTQTLRIPGERTMTTRPASVWLILARSRPSRTLPPPLAEAYQKIGIFEIEEDQVNLRGQVASPSVQFAPFMHDYVYLNDSEDGFVVIRASLEIQRNTCRGSAVYQVFQVLTRCLVICFKGVELCSKHLGTQGARFLFLYPLSEFCDSGPASRLRVVGGPIQRTKWTHHLASRRIPDLPPWCECRRPRYRHQRDSSRTTTDPGRTILIVLNREVRLCEKVSEDGEYECRV